MAPRARIARDIPWCGLHVTVGFSRVVQEPRAGRTRGKDMRRSSSLATREPHLRMCGLGKPTDYSGATRGCGGSGKLAHFSRISVEPGTRTSILAMRSWKSKGARQGHPPTA